MQQITDGDEQGFTQEPSTQIIEIQPIRAIVYNSYTPKVYTHPLKLILPHQMMLKKQYINEELQNQRRRCFEMKQTNVIYNCHDKAKMFSLKNLIFDSNFESGNLEYVIQNNPYQYWLYIRPDLNTKSHFQWFYFTVKNKKPQKCTFIIKNFIKSSLYYRNGLKPFYRSKLRQMDRYQQIPSEVTFSVNQNQQNQTKFYQLQFSFHFDKKNDQTQFCSQPPYTYSHLNHMLKRNNHLKIDLGKTILGHSIYALVINQSIQTKAVIVALARQHPGQSVASWMMEGFIKKISYVPNNFTWIIVPMVNIDGVIVGNNRNGILGNDFNRNWYLQESQKSLNPQILSIIRYIKSKKNDYKKKTKMFLDFHGHSSEPNVFTYGSPYPKQSKYYNLSRLFPYLINKKNANFSFKQCSYEIQQSKTNCARSIFLNKLGFPLSFTIQSSFGIYQNRQINEVDIMKIGQDICDTTIQFLKLVTTDPNQHNPIKQLINIMKTQITQHQNYVIDNSESEDQNQNDPIRIKFVKRIEQMFLKNLQHNSKGRKTDLKSVNKNINSSAKTIGYVDEQNSKTGQPQKQKFEPNSHKIKISRQRLKTQNLRDDKQTGNNLTIKNIILPKINQSIKTSSPSNKKGSLISQLNFDIMTLTEIKQKLFSMKKSKLGRRFLILQ